MHISVGLQSAEMHQGKLEEGQKDFLSSSTPKNRALSDARIQKE